MDVLC